jgi:hypothetical protein
VKQVDNSWWNNTKRLHDSDHAMLIFEIDSRVKQTFKIVKSKN